MEKNKSTEQPNAMTRERRKSKESRAKEKKKKQNKKRENNQNCTKTLHNILSKHQVKSKVDSLTETTDGTDPRIISIVETHMLKEEEITIPG